MTVKGYEIDTQQHIVPIDPEHAAERSQEPGSMLWLDVEGLTRRSGSFGLSISGLTGLPAGSVRRPVIGPGCIR